MAVVMAVVVAVVVAVMEFFVVMSVFDVVSMVYMRRGGRVCRVVTFEVVRLMSVIL